MANPLEKLGLLCLMLLSIAPNLYANSGMTSLKDVTFKATNKEGRCHISVKTSQLAFSITTDLAYRCQPEMIGNSVRAFSMPDIRLAMILCGGAHRCQEGTCGRGLQAVIVKKDKVYTTNFSVESDFKNSKCSFTYNVPTYWIMAKDQALKKVGKLEK